MEVQHHLEPLVQLPTHLLTQSKHLQDFEKVAHITLALAVIIAEFAEDFCR